ncbi:MAG: response regulator transcription factor [Bacteroidota bacterium]
MSKTYKILIADDHAMIRKGINAILTSQEKMNFEVFECENGLEVISFIMNKQIDLILLDISMPVMNGLEVLNKIRTELELDIPILMMTSHYNEHFIKKSIEYDTTGYILKYVDVEELLAAISSSLRKEHYYSKEIQKIISDIKKNNRHTSVENLTKLQQKILKMIVNEKTSSEIAEELFLSVRTIEGHRQRILSKLNLKNSISLVKYALTNQDLEILE